MTSYVLLCEEDARRPVDMTVREVEVQVVLLSLSLSLPLAVVVVVDKEKLWCV